MLLKKDISGIYNIGSGISGVSVNELAECIHSVFGLSKIAIKHDLTKPEDTNNSYFDESKAVRDLRFQAEYSLIDGMKDYKYEIKK